AGQNRGQYELCRFHMRVARCSRERGVMRQPRSLPLTPIAKPMNRFAACGDPRAESGPRMVTMTKDEMVKWFKSAAEGSRHQRMLWAAHKIARLTGATEGGAYRMLLVALIEAERLPHGSIPGFSMTADE